MWGALPSKAFSASTRRPRNPNSPKTRALGGRAEPPPHTRSVEGPHSLARPLGSGTRRRLLAWKEPWRDRLGLCQEAPGAFPGAGRSQGRGPSIRHHGPSKTATTTQPALAHSAFSLLGIYRGLLRPPALAPAAVRVTRRGPPPPRRPPDPRGPARSRPAVGAPPGPAGRADPSPPRAAVPGSGRSEAALLLAFPVTSTLQDARFQALSLGTCLT